MKPVLLVAAIVAVLVVVSSVVGYYFVSRWSGGANGSFMIGGESYRTSSLSWQVPRMDIVCPSTEVAEATNLITLPWSGAIYSITQAPESCSFPGINGSFAFNLSVSVVVRSISTPYAWQDWSTQFGFYNVNGTWSSLTVTTDGGKYGVSLSPSPGMGPPDMNFGVGFLYSYQFLLLAES